MNALELKVSRSDTILSWTDEQGVDMAILGPKVVAPDTDYLASSFDVTSQCQAV